VTAVPHRRIALGLPMPASKIHRWNPRNDKLFGTRPDREVAELLDRTGTKGFCCIAFPGNFPSA